MVEQYLNSKYYKIRISDNYLFSHFFLPLLLTFHIYTVDTVIISFTAKSLQLVLREKDAKSAEIKLVAKETELELENVLCYPPMCTLFEEFMISEHAPENLFFIRSIELFEDVCERLERRVKKLQKGEDVIFKKIKKPVRFKTTFSPPSKKIIVKKNKNDNDNINSNDNDDKERIKNDVCCTTLFDEIVSNASDETIMKSKTIIENTKLTIIAAVCSSVTHYDVLHDIFMILENIVMNIMKEYITEGSNNQINLPGKMRVQLEENVHVFLRFLNDMNNTRQDEFDNLNNNDDSSDNNQNESNSNNNNNDSNSNRNNNNNNNNDNNNDNNINNYHDKNSNNDILKKYLNLSNKRDSCNTPNNMKNLFSKAKNECYMIMRKDTFARWRFTEKFSHFYESLQPPSNVGMNILID